MVRVPGGAVVVHLWSMDVMSPPDTSTSATNGAHPGSPVMTVAERKRIGGAAAVAVAEMLTAASVGIRATGATGCAMGSNEDEMR